MRPSSMPKLSRTTLVIGARQLVVQEALEMMVSVFCKSLSFTPNTTVRTPSPFPGAVMRTFFAPAVKCPCAFSACVNNPVASIAISAPSSFHGNAAGPSFTARQRMRCPLTTSVSSPSASTVPLKCPWTESYFNKYAKLSAPTRSLTATTSTISPKSFCSQSARNTNRPMRPNPLIPTRIFIQIYYKRFRSERQVHLVSCGTGCLSVGIEGVFGNILCATALYEYGL